MLFSHFTAALTLLILRLYRNMKLHLLLIAVSTFTSTSAYVLLQVRKGENQSNVDALIHKVVPSGKLETLTDTGRKRFTGHEQYHAKNKNRDDKKLESIVIAINSGATSDDRTGSDVFDHIVKKARNFLERGAIKAIPKYRATFEKFHIKPEIVRFNSGKPSVMFEVNTKEVMRSIQNFLESKTVRKYADKIAEKMAIIYRTVQDELMKENHEKSS